MRCSDRRTAEGEHPPLPTAVVLCGGGARGAYEVGVLQFIYEKLLPRAAGQRLFDVFAGTSVGALNACSLACMAHQPREGMQLLVDYWRSVTMDRLLRFGPEEMARLPNVVLGRRVGFDFLRTRLRPPRPSAAPHPPVAGVFNTSPLYQEMRREILWDLLQDNLRSGSVRGVAVCATEVCTSKSVIFYQMAPNAEYRKSKDGAKEERAVCIGVEHAMASSAIPFIFPAIQINGVCFMDGAFRNNAPLSPALRMDASRVLVVGLAQPPEQKYATARMGCRRTPFPGSLFLLGRTVRAVMDGVLEREIQHMEMFNEILRQGRETYGAEFLENLNRVARGYRNADYRTVHVQQVRPSRNLNDLAIEALRDAPHEIGLPGVPGKLVKNILTSAPLVESELSSFLMFTPSYVNKLLHLGYRDAERQQEELSRFFFADDRQ